MMRFAPILGISLLVLTFLSPVIQATQIEYRSPRQLGEESSLVVLARVDNVRSYWNETHTKIFTETTVTVDETYKGGTVPIARIVQLGGVVGNVRMTVHGALSWRPGEEILLFLEPLDPGTYQVSGFCQGKFTVEREPGTGKPFVKAPVMEDGRVLNLAPDAPATAPPRVERVSLNKFVNQALGLR
jgi:hypothetical protein